MSILVIEDDQKLVDILCEWLGEKEYETLIAKDEQEAEVVLHEQGDNISIALVDMFLPQKEETLNFKESGLRLIRLMSEKYPSIVPIVHTGNADLYNAARCMEAGAYSYFEKGGDPDLLLQVLNRAEERQKDKSFIRGVRSEINEIQEIAENCNNLITPFVVRLEEVREKQLILRQPCVIAREDIRYFQNEVEDLISFIQNIQNRLQQIINETSQLTYGPVVTGSLSDVSS